MQYKNALKELTEQVKHINGKTVNVRVVIATIESLGIREVDVPNDYGLLSIYELAAYIHKHIASPEFINLKNEAQAHTEKEDLTILLNAYTVVRTKNFVKDYSTGLFHLMPVTIQIACIIVFGLSLWTYSKFNDLQSTAVALGVIMGFTVTGGLLQAIGKQVSFYWYNKDYKMTRESIYNFLKTGIKALLIVFGIVFIINSFLHLFPYAFVSIAFVYELLIGVLLLTLAPLSTIRKRWVISLTITLGTLVSLLLHNYTTLHIYIVHWTGILTCISASLMFIHYYLNNTLKYKKGIKNAYPKAALSVYRNFNYFFYGILVFVFIFTDRILAWSSTLNRNIPYPIYYEENYEIGMDLAIIVFFLLTGVLEYSITSFNRTMDYKIRTAKYNDNTSFNNYLFKSYLRHCLIFFITALGITAILYMVITQPWGYENAFNNPISNISLKVLIMGAAGYFFLTFGMFNVLHLHTLNQHKKPLNAIIIACLINCILGLLLSRIVAYEYSALGMCIGALVFMVLTTKNVITFFKKLDYYYYAAY